MITLAYTCPSKFGPYECGAFDYYVSKGLAWLFALAALVIGALWLYAWAYGKWQDRPEARRQRALDRLDRAARQRERAAAEPEPHSPFRRPPGNQPW